MYNQLTITEARGKLTGLPRMFSQDKKQGAVEITKRGKPVLAIISWERYKTFQETMEILADDQMMESIRRGLSDARQKRSKTLAETRKALWI